MTGFKPFLDDSDFTLGAIDEPPESDEPQMDVSTSDGNISCDAVGMMTIGKDGGVPALLCFDWVELDEESLMQEVAKQDNLDPDDPQLQAEIEELRGEQVVLLRHVVPWNQVKQFSLGEQAQKIFA